MTDEALREVIVTLSGMASPQAWNNAIAHGFIKAFRHLDDSVVTDVVDASLSMDKWRQSPAELLERIAMRSASFPKPDTALAQLRRNILYFRSGERGESEFTHPAIAEAVDSLGGMATIRKSENIDAAFYAAYKKATAERVADIQAALMLPPSERPAELFAKPAEEREIPARVRALTNYNGPEPIDAADRRGPATPALRRMFRAVESGASVKEIARAGKG